LTEEAALAESIFDLILETDPEKKEEVEETLEMLRMISTKTNTSRKMLKNIRMKLQL